MSLAQRLRSFPVWQITLFLALVALGFLVIAQLRSEKPRIRYTTQERQPLIEAVTSLQAQQDQLQSRILDLRAQIAAAEATTQGSDQLVRQLNDALLRSRIAAGLVAIEGPGVILQLDNSVAPADAAGGEEEYSVSGADVRAVVEELWLAGAEAISVNDERVVPTTAIVDIGGTVLVNFAYLQPPYQVKAVGPTDLYEQLALSSGWVDFIQARASRYGIRVSIAEPAAVTIPAYAGSVSMRYSRAAAATPPPAPTPAPTAAPGTPSPSPKATRAPSPKPTKAPKPTPRPARTP